MADTTGSVAGLGGIPVTDPCGAFAASPRPGATGFAPPVADAEDAEVDAVDADAVADRGWPADGIGCPGLPGTASGFRPPDPGLSASLGGGVTGKSSNVFGVAAPP
ncbi:hypothetical protein [Methylobacterium sp. P5_C11]